MGQAMPVAQGDGEDPRPLVTDMCGARVTHR
jgi:hypothetical protein